MTDWGTLRRLADAQRGLLTRAQCLRAGMSDDALRWRVGSKRWVRLHDGVFLTTPGRDDWWTTSWAVLLSIDTPRPASDVAYAGHAAAFLWGLRPRPPLVTEFVVPHGRRVVAPEGTSLRRSRRWVGYLDELADPARTTSALTVVDCAALGSVDDALGIVTTAVRQRLVTSRQLRQELDKRRGHPHGTLLREVLGEIEDGAESPAEVRYVRDVERAHGLPTAERQGASDRGRRRYHDNRYTAYGLIVEVDGRVGHERWEDRVRDGRRDRSVAVDGTLTSRVFWPDVTVGACDTARDVGQLLRLGGWQGHVRACRRRRCILRLRWAE